MFTKNISPIHTFNNDIPVFGHHGRTKEILLKRLSKQIDRLTKQDKNIDFMTFRGKLSTRSVLKGKK